MLPTVSFRTMRFISALVVLGCAVMLVTPLSLPSAISPDRAVVSALIFYGVTAGAYGLLPFVRRGDIFMGAMWLVLAVGVAPCVEGEELSPLHMFADMAGVLMAAGPISLSLYLLVAQGDSRHIHHHKTDKTTKPTKGLGVTSIPAAS